ncbi:zinc finger MYM-type protein 1-like, partial [Aphis craccivora]
QKFQPAKVGETVRIRVPDVDRSKMDPQNILAVVLDIVDNDFYKLATKNGVINRLYTRNQFSVCKENLISISDVQRNQQIPLREAST